MRSAILPGCLQERVPLPPALLLVRAGLSGLPLPTGAQRARFASEGEAGYATWAAGSESSSTSAFLVLFLPALRGAGECSTLRPFCCSPLVLLPRHARPR